MPWESSVFLYHRNRFTRASSGASRPTSPTSFPTTWASARVPRGGCPRGSPRRRRFSVGGTAASLGVIIFELLAGRRPYTASGAYEWITLHSQDTPPPDLQSYGVPPQLARAVRRMMARLPEQRQQSMREVIQDLRLAGHGLRPIPALSPQPLPVSAGGPTLQLDSAGAPLTPAAAPSYLQPAATPPPSYLQPTPPSPFRLPYSQQDPLARARLRRIGEFLLGAAVVFIYLIVYWQDTLTFLRTFAKSLRFGF